MSPKTSKYIYTFNYDFHHDALCKLESRQIFGEELENKMLFSDFEVDPSSSPYIKNRLELLSSSSNYADLLENIKAKDIRIHGFKVDYLILEGDPRRFPERCKLEKDVGYCMEAAPDFENPSITFSIGYYKEVWYFGILTKQLTDWHKHKKKPFSFSNSIGMNTAKALVSIAAKGNKSNRLLDACCGVGTIMLEACYSGFSIEGCDIASNLSNYTKQNLAHYNYTAKVYHSDIKDLDTAYEAAIIDLPYNLYTYSNDTIVSGIIESTAKLTTRLVIVSISDIEDHLQKAGLKVTDSCIIEKKGKSKFARKIWICGKEAVAGE